MLNQPTMEKLLELRLYGMANAFRAQLESIATQQLSFDERFALLVDQQCLWKQNRALIRRLQAAKLKERATIEDVDYQHPRGLDRKLLRTLASSEWVRQKLNLVLTGPTGIGKTWIAFAMAPLKDSERRDFLEVCDDRYQHRSLILTSQMPVPHWHEQIGDPTVADSILDRILHNAYRLELKGESMRKKLAHKPGQEDGQ